MTTEMAKPRYDAGRRFRWLGVAIVLAILAYSAAWYWLARQVDRQTDILVETQRLMGTQIDCPGRSVGGYPFRFEISCASLAVARQSDGLVVEGGGFRTDSLVYRPNRVEAELEAPVTVQAPVLGGMTLDWKNARGVATLGQPVPEKASAAVESLVVGLPGLQTALSADHAEAHLRTDGPDLDLAMRYEGLVLDERLTAGRQLPALAGDADIVVTNGAALAAEGVRTLRGVEGVARRIALLLTPKRGVLVSGPFSVGQDGLVDAKLELIVVDPAGVASDMKTVFPEYASQIDIAAAGGAQAGPDGTPEIRLTVTISDGRVSLGFIPVGRIPPLPQ